MTEYGYQTTARPAWAGETVPADGFVRKFSANDPVWAAAECAVYSRRLTAEEIARYELLPFSDNAYAFAVGEQVVYLYNEDVYTVTAHVGGKYHLRHECGDVQEYIRESHLDSVVGADQEAQETNMMHPEFDGKLRELVRAYLPIESELDAEVRDHLRDIAEITGNDDVVETLTKEDEAFEIIEEVMGYVDQAHAAGILRPHETHCPNCMYDVGADGICWNPQCNYSTDGFIHF